MASATLKTVEKTVTENVIVLELTKDEAGWLRDALSMNYGNNGHYSEAIIKALDAPDSSSDSDDRPIEVGDKVRIVKANSSRSYNGRIGRLISIDSDDIPYRVDFSDGDFEWATIVERVND